MRLFLLFIALFASRVHGLCGGCTYGAQPGTYIEQCLKETTVVSCHSGQINVTISPTVSYAFDRATCLDGAWYGSTCEGAIFMLTGPNPFFNCIDTVITTPAPTTTTQPPPPPCTCSFQDTGAALNMPPPTSSCTNGANQVVECDGKIYAKVGQDLVEYDRVSCSAGKWYGTSCEGTVTAMADSTVKVQCGKTAEPPFCASLPKRGGLKYIGTFDGLQRYACNDDLVVRIQFTDGSNTTTNHGKYVDCNNAMSRTASTDGFDFFLNGDQITDVSCRDYGTFNKACAVPASSNAVRQDGTIGCEKGSYMDSIAIIKAGNTKEVISSDSTSLSTVTCGNNWWTITGTSNVGVPISFVWCKPAPDHYGSCLALKVEPRSVQYEPNKGYSCRYPAQEQLRIGAPGQLIVSNTKLECVGSDWIVDGATVPAGASISCTPIHSFNVLQYPTSLVSAGFALDGAERWTCDADRTLYIDIEFFPEQGKHKPVHAAYIVANSVQYMYSADDASFNKVSKEKILRVECVDLGPKHAACTTPYDIGGMRNGNSYSCQKGFYLNNVQYKDASGAVKVINGSQYDMKGMECRKDGWQLQGTLFTGLPISVFECYDASLYAIDKSCGEATVKAATYALKYDMFRSLATCYDGEALGYTLNGQDVRAPGKKLFCSLNSSSGKREWQWSNMDGSDVSVIPSGALIKCFA